MSLQRIFNLTKMRKPNLDKASSHRPEYVVGILWFNRIWSYHDPNIETSKNNMIYSITGEADDMSDMNQRRTFPLK